LWHGIGGAFLIWGLIHAASILIENYSLSVRNALGKRLGKLWRLLAVIYTFSIVVFANIFFSASTITEAQERLAIIFHSSRFTIHSFIVDVVAPFEQNGNPEDVFNFSITIITVLLFVFLEKRIQKLFAQAKYVYIVYGIALLLVLFIGQLSNTQEFMYAQF